MNTHQIIEFNRYLMRSPNFDTSMAESDMKKKLPAPPLNKPITGEKVVLRAFDDSLACPNYMELLDKRRSQRKYAAEPISQEQLAFILWSAQGIQKSGGVYSLRPAPSGGGRHAFETYVTVRDVDGLKPGLYRYAPLENIGEKIVTLDFLGAIENYAEAVSAAMDGQKWAANTNVVLIYSSVAYRCEWQYATAAARLMLMDVGHIGQNIMLSAEAVGLGSCCIAAYDQAKCDELIRVNGKDEFSVYAIPVGKVK
jgi:SagB-type dehydrogenase family enzyme